MRRSSVVLLLAAVILGSLVVAGGRFAAAQTPVQAGHPAVGSWMIHRTPANAVAWPNELLVLNADGTAIEYGAYQTTGIGAWEATGDRTATVTFTLTTDGPAYVVIRASIEIAPDGKTLKGTYTAEFIFDPEHNGTSGQIGPGGITGERLTAQAPGTPAQSFDQFLPPAGTPEATPTS
jgi:hypothetical protein